MADRRQRPRRGAVSGEGFTVFETPLGWCGLAWSQAGITAAVLPERGAAAARARLSRRRPGAPEAHPPPAVAAAAKAIIALLAGEAADLDAAVLDLGDASDFDRRVYAAAREIPVGATATYGELADRIGAPDAAREVGQALGRNPVPIIVPCHRVLAAGGKIGGFSGPGGIEAKRRLLAVETGAGPLFER